MSYLEGVKTGAAMGSDNPFSVIIGKVKEAQERKIAEKMADERDLKELQTVFQTLSKKHEYETQLEKQRSESGIQLERERGAQDRLTKMSEGYSIDEEGAAPPQNGNQRLLQMTGMASPSGKPKVSPDAKGSSMASAFGFGGMRVKKQDDLKSQKAALEVQKLQKEISGEQVLTATERNYKRKQQKDFSEAFAQNNSNRKFIKEATPLIDNLPSGLPGRIKLGFMKQFNANSPVLGDWQKIKSILTDTTLLQSMKTKGAISDREMDEFKQAAANDNLISKSRIKAAFERYKQILDAEDTGKIDAYYKSFGEDPRGEKPEDDVSNMSDEELKAIINGR